MLTSALLSLVLTLPQGGAAGLQGWETLPPPPYGFARPPSDSADSGEDGVDPAAGSGHSGDGAGGSGGTPGSSGAGGSASGSSGTGGSGIFRGGQPGGTGPFAPTADGVSTAFSARSGLDTALELDRWPIWWRLQRESFLVVQPWPLTPTTGRGFAFPGNGDTDSNEPRVTPGLAQGRLVPALLHVLEEDPSPALRASVLLSLARIGELDSFQLGPSKLQDLFVSYLTDPNQRVSETACISLGVLGRPAALSQLAALVADDSTGHELIDRRSVPTRMRTFATYGIGLIGARTKNPDVSRFALTALDKSLESGPGTSSDLRVAAIVALSAMAPVADRGLGDSIAARLLEIHGKRGESVEARAQVPGTLAALYTNLSPALRAKTIRVLLDGAIRRSERDAIRQGCAIALGRIGDRGESATSRTIRRRLTELATGGDQRLRSIALVSLAQVATRPAGALLDGGDGGGPGLAPDRATEEVSHFLQRRLGRISNWRSDDEAWIALALGLVAHGKRQLGEARDPNLPFVLREGLRRAPSPVVRTAYGIALGLAGNEGALEDLTHALEQVEPDLRGLIAEGLGMSGAQDAIPPLRALLEDSDHRPAPLASAARALALLHDPELVEQLAKMRERSPGTFASQGITRALGLTRHPDAADPLLHLLGDPRAPDLERAYAAIGIGLLGQKDAMDWTAILSVNLHYRAAPATLLSPVRDGILDLP